MRLCGPAGHPTMAGTVDTAPCSYRGGWGTTAGMAWVERTVSCPECSAERTTKAGAGTLLACRCGHRYRAPAPAPDPPASPSPNGGGSGGRVPVVRAGATKVRRNARPKRAAPPTRGRDDPPVDPDDDLLEPPGVVGDEPPPPKDPAPPPKDPAPPAPPAPVPPSQSGRRGGLGFYGRKVLARRAS